MTELFVVGISGGSAAGKTTVAKNLVQRLSGFEPSVVEVDRYFKDHSNLSETERLKLNYDIPLALDFDKLAEDILKLKHGRAILAPEYDYANHKSIPGVFPIKPATLIIVEGILLFHPSAIKPLLDYRIFVEADRDERLRRRIARDVVERGRSEASVITQFNETVEPGYTKYTLPTRDDADFILDWNSMNNEAIAQLSAILEPMLV